MCLALLAALITLFLADLHIGEASFLARSFGLFAVRALEAAWAMHTDFAHAAVLWVSGRFAIGGLLPWSTSKWERQSLPS